MRKIREVKYEGGVKLYKCSSCGEFLSKENFAKNIYGYDFISSECRKCSNERMKEYRKQNKEKLNAYQKSYKAKRMMMYEAQSAAQPKDIHLTPGGVVASTDKVGAWQGLSAHQSQSDGVSGVEYIPDTHLTEGSVITSSSVNSTTAIPIPEPIPQPVELTKTEKPIEINSQPKSHFSSRLEKLEQENAEAQKQEEQQKQDDEIVIQAAIDKNPDAYTEILSDEDLLNAFNNRSVESKINELTRRQQKFDKQKKEKEYNIKKEKMRDLVDATLDDKQKRHFEDKLHSLHEEQQDIFVDRMASLSKASFPILREEIFDKLLENQTGKTSLSV